MDRRQDPGGAGQRPADPGKIRFAIREGVLRILRNPSRHRREQRHERARDPLPHHRRRGEEGHRPLQHLLRHGRGGGARGGGPPFRRHGPGNVRPRPGNGEAAAGTRGRGDRDRPHRRRRFPPHARSGLPGPGEGALPGGGRRARPRLFPWIHRRGGLRARRDLQLLPHQGHDLGRRGNDRDRRRTARGGSPHLPGPGEKEFYGERPRAHGT